MSFKIADFTDQILIVSLIHKWYANKAAELNTIAAALATDTAVRSTELTAAVVGLRPGLSSHTRFTNVLCTVADLTEKVSEKCTEQRADESADSRQYDAEDD